jgi:hypothetical protein
MHLPAVQRQLFTRVDTDVSCHSLSLSFLAVYCLPWWVTVMMPPERGALRRQCCMHRLLNH